MSLYLKIGQRKNDINFFSNFPPHISVKVFDRTGQSSWAVQKIIGLKKKIKKSAGGRGSKSEIIFVYLIGFEKNLAV